MDLVVFGRQHSQKKLAIHKLAPLQYSQLVHKILNINWTSLAGVKHGGRSFSRLPIRKIEQGGIPVSFCCGASMIGTKGTLKHIRTHIHNVPILFCPVCHRIEVHHLAQSEYDILADYAHGDGATEVDFIEYVDGKDDASLFENCVNTEEEQPIDVVQNQIDMALDLMMVAKQLEDGEWETQLIKRLHTLSKRKAKLKQKNTMGGSI
jgi:hypothetical protein